MHIKEIALINWGPFRGVHSLELGPGVFGVVARHDADEGRSNWLGKSWLLGAIRFALHGRLPVGCADADGWITRGEDRGTVGISLSDGTHIERLRIRGKSTQLHAGRPGEDSARQKEAQNLIDEWLGLNREDVEAALVVAQKQADRMVTDDPSEKTAVVDGWIGLGPLRRAEKWATDSVADWLATVEQEERERDDAAVRVEEAGDPEEHGRAAESLAEKLAAAEKRLEAAEAAEREARERAAERARHEERAEERTRAEERASEAREALRAAESAQEGPSAEAAEEAAVAASAAEGRAEELQTLVKGDGFDGTCPVTCEDCPVAADIRARGREMGEQADEAETKAEGLREIADVAGKARETARQAEAVRTGWETELERQEARLEELGPAPEKSGGSESGRPDSDVPAAAAAVAGYREEKRTAEKAAESAREAASALEDADAEVLEARHWEAAWRDAAVVLRRARRAIAARAMAQIEAGANELLSEAGVDLSVQVRWERETKELADVCERCGRPFPRSRAIKACEGCSAARGPKKVERLDVIPVPRSGAADDVAGLATQLSAAAWLRRKRGAAWATVLIDEALAACDSENASRVTTALLGVLRRRHGFEQAFVVSHRPEEQDRMPAKIVIRSDGTNARLEVQR